MQLTENQKRAVESVDVSTAIIAGAGSGKTEVLTQRLIYILNSGKINLNQILCVTFTEKAAHELKKRVAQYLPEESKKDLPWAAIGTFHSFCLNLLREQAPLLGFSGAIEVWDEHTARLAIHRHCRKTLLEALDNKEPEAVLLLDAFEFRETLLLLEELMQFRWHFEGTMDNGPWTMDQKQKTLHFATTYLYKKILSSYTAEKKEREVMDFQDLEMEALNLLNTNKEVLKQYQSRFKHILVDEVQDINDLQKNLIEMLFNPKENRLCMVGDPKQSIYRFRGANVTGLQSLSDKILKAGGHRIELQENFRSRPAILNWINALFENIFPANLFIPLIPTREKTTEANIHLLPIDGNKKLSNENRRKIEAERIVEYIQHLVHSGKNSYGDITLLFQALSDIRHYEKALRAAQIPYRL
ncbi:MAG: ATP-dependent helicase, partial [Deltaproteobacteria bacterium]|nr:ATP-dependent helicase [Deltaproteobacteria bacterium]